MDDNEERELQLVIVRGLLYVVLPLCIVLGSLEYIYKGNVNPFLLSIGSGISGAIVAMLKTGRGRPTDPEEMESGEMRGGGLRVKRPK